MDSSTYTYRALGPTPAARSFAPGVSRAFAAWAANAAQASKVLASTLAFKREIPEVIIAQSARVAGVCGARTGTECPSGCVRRRRWRKWGKFLMLRCFFLLSRF